MKVAFACPSCGAAGAVDEALAGRRARCKGCGHQFTIPRGGRAEEDLYALEETAETAGAGPDADSAFVAARGDAPTESTVLARPKGPARRPSSRKRAARGGAGVRTWLVRGAIAFVVLVVAVALLAPRGPLLAGCLVTLLGMLMVLVGFAAGAYGAFSEDLIYGILYLAIPLYTGYYIVTRWDDLWPWFTCSTVGVALVTVGTALLSWAGLGV